MKTILLLLGSLTLVSCQIHNQDLQAKADTATSWKQIIPGTKSPPEKWWREFKDPVLNQLVESIDPNNLELRASYARIEQTRANLGIARSDLLPTVSLDGNITRNRLSGDEAIDPRQPNPLTQYRTSFLSSWEIDLWGRIDQQIRSASAQVRANQASTEDLALSLRSQAARSYLTLRFLEKEKRLLSKIRSARQSTLSLVQKQVAAGRGNAGDTAQARANVHRIEAEISRLDSPIIREANNLAVLTGMNPSRFELANGKVPSILPKPSPGTQLSVLQRRPDVAAAAFRLSSANAQVGVAQRDFFPRLILIGSAGLSSLDSSSFLDWSNRTYSFGPNVSLPIFQGGRLKNNLAASTAAQKEALANFQQTSLNAIREVEDTLATLSSLLTEISARKSTLEATRQNHAITKSQFAAGRADALALNIAEENLLQDERAILLAQRLQYENTIQFIKAIGGGLASKK